MPHFIISLGGVFVILCARSSLSVAKISYISEAASPIACFLNLLTSIRLLEVSSQRGVLAEAIMCTWHNADEKYGMMITISNLTDFRLR